MFLCIDFRFLVCFEKCFMFCMYFFLHAACFCFVILGKLVFLGYVISYLLCFVCVSSKLLYNSSPLFLSYVIVCLDDAADMKFVCVYVDAGWRRCSYGTGRRQQAGLGSSRPQRSGRERSSKEGTHTVSQTRRRDGQARHQNTLLRHNRADRDSGCLQQQKHPDTAFSSHVFLETGEY